METFYVATSTAAIVLIVISIILLAISIPKLKEGLKEEKIEQGEEWIRQIVYAMEQIHKELSGEDKKRLAMEQAQKLMKERRISLQEEMIHLLIESEVFKMKKLQRSND